LKSTIEKHHFPQKYIWNYHRLQHNLLPFLVAHKGTSDEEPSAKHFDRDINDSVVNNMLLGAAAAFSNSFDSCARMYVHQLPLRLIGTGYFKYQASLQTMLRSCWRSKN